MSDAAPEIRPLEMGLAFAWLWLLLALTAPLGTQVGELAVSWTGHLALLLLVGGLGLFRDRVMTAIAGLGAAVAVLPWIPAALAEAAPVPDPEGPTTSVLVANFFWDNPEVEAGAAAVEASGADLVALLEPPTDLVERLRRSPEWVDVASHLRSNKDNIALLVRRRAGIEVRSAEPVTVAGHPNVFIDALIAIRGRTLRVFALHPPAPTTAYQHRARDAVYRELVRRLAEHDGAAVVLGDLNATAASVQYRRLLSAGLRPPTGVRPATWPSWLGSFGIALDHVLASGGVRLTPLEVTPLPASDHRGLEVGLQLD